ncbi:MAG: hypothetical protein KDE27_08410 [Planctomycetes bacterium]|nr:hypothetical protein [Planctomycetota bacterium]
MPKAPKAAPKAAAKAAPKAASHRWSFYRAGGVDQVRLDSGADILNLDQLDQKLWVALSCPVKGLEIDTHTLELLDADGDGYVRPPEILAATRWLREVLKDGDSLTDGEDAVALAKLRKDTDEGKALLASAEHMLTSLGRPDAAYVSVADALAIADVLKNAERNGDGVVRPAVVADEGARALAEEVVKCMGGVPDRSGQDGFDQSTLDAFFTACTEYDAWWQQAEADGAKVLPLGDKTPAAWAALSKVRAKVDDYFGRCRLAAFDPRAIAAVNREEEAYIAAAAKDLTITAEEVASFPLALVEADKPLSLTKGINPAWAGAIADLRATCFAGKDTITEADWIALCAKLDPHGAWADAPAGTAVAGLGKDRVRAILAGEQKAPLQQEIEADLAVAPEVDAMAKIDRLVHLHRDLHQLLNNYVSFTDFYARRGAIFQAGTLYLDRRSLELCFHVNDAGKHALMAPMSKSYLAYVDCTRPGEPKMQVACAFTNGDSDYLFVGRNGVFYDRKGNDWNATISKIVDNPISIRQAFFSPYKKLMRWIEEQINKRAAAAESASSDKLTSAAGKAGDAAATGKAAEVKKFDPSVVALFSVAISGVVGIVGTVIAVLAGLGVWLPLAILGIVLAISGPSMLIAWLKLRQRNLGPILDANGWAVNTLTKVNVPLGGSLTDLPKLPAGAERSLADPYAPKKSIWPRVLFVLILLGIAAYVLYRTNLLYKWTDGYVPAHHSEVDLSAEPKSGPAGTAIVFTVKSGDDKLEVSDVTDSNAVVNVTDLAVEGGKATFTIPEGAKAGTVYEIIDSCGGGTVSIEVTAPPEAPK